MCSRWDGCTRLLGTTPCLVSRILKRRWMPTGRGGERGRPRKVLLSVSGKTPCLLWCVYVYVCMRVCIFS